MKELSKSKIEIDCIKRQMLQQEIAFNIQQTDALTRSLSPTAGEPSSLLRSNTSQLSPYDSHSLSRRHLKSKVNMLDDDTSKVRGFESQNRCKLSDVKNNIIF